MSLIGLPKEILDIGFANLTAPLAALFPSLPSATITTLYLGTPHAHAHPPSLIPPAPPIPLPSMGPVTLGTCVKVLINSLPAARVKDLGYAFTCGGLAPIFQIKTGSSNVFIGGHRAARMGDICVACVKGESRSVDAGAFMSALGTAASIASKGLQVAGMMAGLAGVVADAAQAAVEDDAAMASAMALAAAMSAAQMAADAVAMALSQTMGTDPGIPPSVGALLMGHPTVLIGGFPMIDIPNPINMILDKLSQFKAKSPPENGGCGEEGEPVDVVTGANVDDSVDYQTRAHTPFCWHRHYDSQLHDQDGPLGRGHRHEYQRELGIDLDGFRYTDEKGGVTGFPPFPDGEDRVANHGFILCRIDSQNFRIEADGKPAMEFRFQDLGTPAPISRLKSPPHSIDFHYDSRQRLVALFCPRRWMIKLDYDERDHVVQVRVPLEPAQPDQVLATYMYDQAGNLISWTDALGHRALFEYDAESRLTRKTDRSGYSYYYEYDRAGRCIHTYGEDGLYDVRCQYMPEVRSTIATFSDGGAWTYFYDENGNVTRIIDPYGGSRLRNIDEHGRVVEEIGPGGSVTRLLYNSAGAHIGRRDAMGYFSAPLRDEPHPSHPLAHRVLPTPLQWEYGYLVDQRRIGVSAPDKRMLRRLPKQIASAIRKNAEGAGNSHVRLPSYDIMGRMVEEVASPGRVRRWSYDPNGNPTEYTDADGSVYRYHYASWNLLSRAIDPMGHTVSYQYSHREQLRGVWDARGVRTEYEYDLKDRLVKASRNGVVREEYRYDLGDNLIEKITGDGKSLLTFEIGEPGLKSVRRLASGEKHSFEYSESGRFLRAATDQAEVLFDYGPQDQMLRDERDGRGVSHVYADGKLAKTVYFGKFTTMYRANRVGRWAIEDPTGAKHWITPTRSGLILREMSNRSTELCQYDVEGRCKLKARWRGESFVSQRIAVYVYSAEGDLVSVQESATGTTLYEYDAAHRLIRETLPSGVKHDFEYDEAGNLLRQPGLVNTAIDEGNRLRSANGQRFSYDDRDNISQREGPLGTIHYEYDARAMLTRCKNGRGEWRAQYDPLGRRVAKSWSENRVEFYWDMDRLAAEVHADGRARLYIYADATALVPLLFVEYASLDAPPESGRRYFVFCNQIGAPVHIEDDRGESVWSARLSPYGWVEVRPGAAIEFSLRFPGHYHDAETGLHYNRFRYYSPELGRYLQPDPIGIGGGVNLYAYSASPLSQVDLNGRHPKQPGKGGEENEDPEDGDDKYPGRRAPLPGCEPPEKTRSDENAEGYAKALAAVGKGHNDPEGVWDQEALANDPRLKSTLDKFDDPNDPTGKSVKNLDLSGKTPEEIHDELIANGFEHERKGIIAFPRSDPDEYKTYDPSTGQFGRSADPNDPNLVPQDFYTHDDGGMVRVKPEGDPGNGQRPQPQVSKSVLDPPDDTGWPSGPGGSGEQFKVTNDGDPVPRAPKGPGGMSQGPGDSSGSDENSGWGDGAMDSGHTNLPPSGP